MVIVVLLPLLSSLFVVPSHASPRLPKGTPRPPIVEDLPPPHNLQGQAIKKSSALSWSWMPHEETPAFLEFGFEVERRDGKRWMIADTTFKDFDVEYGSYAYRVRVRGLIKEKGKKVTHLSRWAGPLEVEIPVFCPAAPEVTLEVRSTQSRYAEAPSLRLRLTGQVRSPAECQRLRAFYTVDSGAGQAHSGPVTLHDEGRFDDWIDAVQPGEEIASGVMDYSVTVTAENESGAASADPARIRLQLENRFAPRDPF